MEANRRTSCSTKSAATDEMSIKPAAGDVLRTRKKPAHLSLPVVHQQGPKQPN